MKDVIGFFSVFAVLALVCWCTCPADDTCRREVLAHYAGDEVAGLLDGNAQYLIRVEDHVFYKTIINRVTGNTMGTAAFCTVFF